MELTQKVISEYKEGELIDLACSLIEIPSVVGNEQTISNYLGKELMKLGFSVDYVEAKRGRPNVIACLNGQEDEGGIILVGHMDTVPPDQGTGKPWRSDPFKADLRNRRLYGLGSGDMKGGIAAILVAVKTLMAARVNLKKRLTIVFCVDEEAGSIEGMKYIAEKNLIKGNLAIAADTTNMCLQGWFKGRTIYEIETKGKSAHPSNPSKGVNAIDHMVDLIYKINHSGFKHKKHQFLGGCTTTFGLIQGGKDVKSIPNLCKAILEVRTVPGQGGEQVMDEINDFIRGLKKANRTFDANIKIINGKDPVEISPKHPIIDVMQKVSCDVIGRELQLGKAGIGGGDIYFLWKNMGIPVINFGPGDVELAHSPNEYVEIKNLVGVSKCYAGFILEFCGGYIEKPE